MQQLINDSKKTITFLGKIAKDGKAQPLATAFFISLDGINHLVTAKHVVIDEETGQIDDELVAFINLKKGGVTSIPLRKVKELENIDWMFHTVSEVDIAIIPFPLKGDKYDTKVIPYETFLPIINLCELYDVFFLSFQPGIELESRIGPIIRSGTISRLNENRTFYLDGVAFPGNSGSPVFLKPSPLRFTEKGITLKQDNLGGKFIGVIGAYITYSEIAISVQTRKPRIIFEENTCLSRVWSVNYLKEIIESEQCQSQIKRLNVIISRQMTEVIQSGLQKRVK